MALTAHKRLCLTRLPLVCAFSGAAFEVLEILAHLLEGKSQSEEAFGRLRTKAARQALAAQLVDLCRVSIKGGFDRIPGRWPTPGAKRFANGTEIVGDGCTGMFHRWSKARQESFGWG